MLLACLVGLLGLTLPVARASPVAPPPEGSVDPVDVATLQSYVPYANFALATYCPGIQSWTCGKACQALPGFIPTLVGGDGNKIQFYFVGYWAPENTVVVAHEGTDPTQLFAVLTDVKLYPLPLNATLFPGAPSDIRVHRGFQNAHAQTAPQILVEVQRLQEEYDTKNVLLIGHSLGAALAQLDSLFLTLNDPTMNVQLRVFGNPRVGNDVYAEFFDSQVTDIVRVNNRQDPVTVVPPKVLFPFSYRHPRGEVHLDQYGGGVACSEPDSDEKGCTNSAIPVPRISNILRDHLGPYVGVKIGTIYCN